jgi:hypothetical protein
MEDKYAYNRFGSKATRVGQAVYDLMVRGDNQTLTAEDIAENNQQKYISELFIAVDRGMKSYEVPFFIVVLFNNEPSLVNVGRLRYCPRQTEPTKEFLMTAFPYFHKDLWKIEEGKGPVYQYTLPSLENFREILKNRNSYSEDLHKYTAEQKIIRLPKTK